MLDRCCLPNELTLPHRLDKLHELNLLTSMPDPAEALNRLVEIFLVWLLVVSYFVGVSAPQRRLDGGKGFTGSLTEAHVTAILGRVLNHTRSRRNGLETTVTTD